VAGAVRQENWGVFVNVVVKNSGPVPPMCPARVETMTNTSLTAVGRLQLNSE
jgi:hypothetical protein